MMQIIKEQGGNPNITPEKIKIGKYKYDVKAKTKGVIKEISNKNLVRIAKATGAPKDKGSGVYINVKLNNKVKRNQIIYTIYAENKNKLNEAIKISNNLKVINIEDELTKTFK
jgi:AMP phosphorylase